MRKSVHRAGVPQSMGKARRILLRMGELRVVVVGCRISAVGLRDWGTAAVHRDFPRGLPPPTGWHPPNRIPVTIADACV
mgnify:CR=1 FL=1